jgi:exosortase/archaeosortase
MFFFLFFSTLIVGLNAYCARFAFILAWTVFPQALVGHWGIIMLQFVLWQKSIDGDATAVYISHMIYVFFIFIGTALGAGSAAKSLTRK